MSDLPTIPGLLLHRLVWLDDESEARRYRRAAHQAGATALDIARAWRYRDERIRSEVQYLVTGNEVQA